MVPFMIPNLAVGHSPKPLSSTLYLPTRISKNDSNINLSSLFLPGKWMFSVLPYTLQLHKHFATLKVNTGPSFYTTELLRQYYIVSTCTRTGTVSRRPVHRRLRGAYEFCR
jgi:hypothetical protein